MVGPVEYNDAMNEPYGSPGYNVIKSVDSETIPIIVFDDSTREIMRLTPDRKLIFASDVGPKEAAEEFARHVNRMFGWEIIDEPTVVETEK